MGFNPCVKNSIAKSVQAMSLSVGPSVEFILLVCDWGNRVSNTQIKRIQKIQNKALQYVINKNNALENKKELQVLDIPSMIELSNLKFGYKVLHNLLPPVTGKTLHV